MQNQLQNFVKLSSTCKLLEFIKTFSFMIPRVNKYLFQSYVHASIVMTRH